MEFCAAAKDGTRLFFAPLVKALFTVRWVGSQISSSQRKRAVGNDHLDSIEH